MLQRPRSELLMCAHKEYALTGHIQNPFEHLRCSLHAKTVAETNLQIAPS